MKTFFKVIDHGEHFDGYYWSSIAPTLTMGPADFTFLPEKAATYNSVDHNWLWKLCQDSDQTGLEAEILPMDQQMKHNGAALLL